DGGAHGASDGSAPYRGAGSSLLRTCRARCSALLGAATQLCGVSRRGTALCRRTSLCSAASRRDRKGTRRDGTRTRYTITLCRNASLRGAASCRDGKGTRRAAGRNRGNREGQRGQCKCEGQCERGCRP